MQLFPIVGISEAPQLIPPRSPFEHFIANMMDRIPLLDDFFDVICEKLLDLDAGRDRPPLWKDVGSICCFELLMAAAYDGLMLVLSRGT